MGILEANGPPPSTPQWDRDPSGWEQGITIGPSGGELVTRHTQPIAPDQWDQVLAELLPPGFDPADYSIDGDTIQVRSWDAAVGLGQTERFYYFKAAVTRRRATVEHDVDLDRLRRRALKRQAVKPRKVATADVALVVHLADWQIGKAPTDATVERIHNGLDAALDRARHEKPASIVLAGLGDLAEGCTGHYPSQPFDVDLDDREQMRVCTRLLLGAIERFLGWPVIVSSCVSNHGEKRQSGKPITGPTDNRDLELLDRVADVMASNAARYQNVSVIGPDTQDPCVTRLDVHGVRVATTHGHVGFKGSNASAAAETWWLGQIKGMRPAADAHVLLSGHRHHWACAELGADLQRPDNFGRTWVQAPALDGGSLWFSSQTGAQSHPGLLTSLVGAGVGRSGIGGYAIHDCG